MDLSNKEIERIRWYADFEWWCAAEGTYTGVSFHQGRLYRYLGNGDWHEQQHPRA